MSGIDPFREKSDPPVDLAQPPFAVLIVGIFTAVAVARRPGHHLRHRPPFPGEQKPELVPKTLQAARGDVVLDGFFRDRRAHPADRFNQILRVGVTWTRLQFVDMSEFACAPPKDSPKSTVPTTTTALMRALKDIVRPKTDSASKT